MGKLKNVKRIVIKIGSSTIIDNDRGLDKQFISNISGQVARLRKHYGTECVIVSSGAVASGRLLEKSLDKSMCDTQVAAIFGQPTLTSEWIKAFKKRKILAGQALYTDSDLVTAPKPLNRAMGFGVVIINENDAVYDRELKAFKVSADNDLLSFFIATIVGADLLIFLTTVPGVFDERGKLLSIIRSKDKVVLRNDGKSELGTGGMDSKLRVSLDFAKRGKIAIIADGRGKNIIGKIMSGEKLGTWITDRI